MKNHEGRNQMSASSTRFKRTSQEMAAIESAGIDPYGAAAAQTLLFARNFVRDQTAIDKPLTQWTVEDVIAAIKASGDAEAQPQPRRYKLNS
jgi:hypothetical protein